MVRLSLSLLVLIAGALLPAGEILAQAGDPQQSGSGDPQAGSDRQQSGSGDTDGAQVRQISREFGPTLQAMAVVGAIDLDGVLDEESWQQAPWATDFIQREPFQGESASEKTLVQIVFSEDTLYVGIRALDSDPDSIIATDMQRDGSQSFRGGRFESGDSIVILLDTFLDGRNAFYFETNPLGARADALITDEGRDRNFEWDGVWDAAARRTEEGWSAEMAIPFNSLRFNPDLETWGLNVRRMIRRKNEEVNWAPIMRDADLYRVSQYGQLTGLVGGRPSRNLRIKPFVTATTAEGIDTPVGERDNNADGGLDLRWGVTDSLTFDLTVNTDFAQVEDDEQRVNLTRFSLFFPEKREFFLENAGIFEFGGGGGGGGGFRAPLLKVFHSRRIGIDGGEQIPIRAGAKLTGHMGEWSVGVLDVQTAREVFPAESPGDDDDIVPSTNWAVLRLKRNVGERSNVGVIFTNRQAAGGDYNRVFGVDADLNPHPRMNLSAFFTSSNNPVDEGENWAAGGGVRWNGPVWRWNFNFDEVRQNYDPQVGFLLRRGVRRFNPQLTFEPRPDIAWLRNLSWETRNTIITTIDGTVESYDGAFRLLGVRTQAGDWFSGGIQPKFERLFEPFEIQDGLIIPAGDYTFHDWGMFINTSDGRPVSAFVRINYGGFFDGDHLSANSTITVRPSAYVSSSTEWNHNDVKLPAGEFETNVYRQRFNISLSPDLSVNSFIQYSDLDDLLSINTRFNWIYRPGADLFIVYNQNWFDGSTQDRAVIFKFTYLLAL